MSPCFGWGDQIVVSPMMQARIEQREMALLGVLAMLAGITATNYLQRSALSRPLIRSAVIVLSLANGVVGLAQYTGASNSLLPRPVPARVQPAP